jgi:hypothetical protein
MTRQTFTVLSAIIVLSAGVRVSTQSLADLARMERARRQAITLPAKLYTNESLMPEPAAAAPAPPTAAAAIGPSVPRAPENRKDSTANNEAFWRQRIESERAFLVRARILVDALQSRINGLTNDVAARDDPAQRALLASARQDALVELDRMKQEIVEHEKAILDIQEEARRAGIPAGWVR